MDQQQQSRLEVMGLYVGGYIKQKEAAERMGLSTRQVRRIAKDYRQHGRNALVHGNRGKVSNRKIRDETKRQVMALVRQFYASFGPTSVSRKLAERHGIRVSKETLRQWMITDGLWCPGDRKHNKDHEVTCERRPRVGELVHIDGSSHDWFEGRAPECSLIAFIDDATSQMLDLQFHPSETMQAYMEGLRRYMARHGRPVALYSDRHSLFASGQKSTESGDRITRLGRALKILNIEGIAANSAQTKGHIGCASQILRNSLVEEMRLADISGMEEGNAFLPEYMEKHNRKFAVRAASDDNAHRPVLHDKNGLDLIFSTHHSAKPQRV